MTTAKLDHSPKVILYFGALLGSVGLGMLFFHFLPMAGIDYFQEHMSATLIILAAGGMIGLLAFVPYSQWVARHRENALIAFMLLNPWIAELVNKLTKAGVPLSNTVILTCLFLLPFVLDSLSSWKKILKQPLAASFLFYLLLIGIYLAIYNIPTVEFGNALAGKKTTNEMHFANCTVFFITICMTINVMFKSTSLKGFFDKFNFWVATHGIILGIGTLISYPLEYNVSIVEGIRRSVFLINFAGPYSSFLSFHVLYLMGIFFYYKSIHHKFPAFFLISMFFLTAALICTFTKSGYAMVAVGTVLIIVLNALHKKNLITTISSILFFGVVMISSTFVFDSISDTKVMDTLESRFSNDDSLTWRYRVWSYLSEDIDPIGNFWGNGFYGHAAKMKLFEGVGSYKTGERFQVTAAHNDFLANLYDLGPLGLVVFITMGIIAIRKIYALITNRLMDPLIRELNSTYIVLTIAFFTFCYVDNTYLLMESPIWLMLTLLYLLTTAPLQGKFIQELAAHD